MLAVVGYIVTYAGVRFPGCEDVPSGFAALSALPGMVWAQMIATWAMMEAANQDQVRFSLLTVLYFPISRSTARIHGF